MRIFGYSNCDDGSNSLDPQITGPEDSEDLNRLQLVEGDCYHSPHQYVGFHHVNGGFSAKICKLNRMQMKMFACCITLH